MSPWLPMEGSGSGHSLCPWVGAEELVEVVTGSHHPFHSHLGSQGIIIFSLEVTCNFATVEILLGTELLYGPSPRKWPHHGSH